MNSFVSPIIVSSTPDWKRWRLYRPFTYQINDAVKVRVPEDFITDYASVPWIFRLIIPQWGRYGKASVLHDYLYQNIMWLIDQASNHDLYVYFIENPRKVSDQIFYRAMIILDTKRWKATIMYYAVRWFGWFAFNK